MLQYSEKSVVASIDRMRSVVEARLQKHKAPRNLLTYDGSLLDQLAYAFVSRAWPADDYNVICSVRPCMHENLRSEVINFADAHGYPCVGYDNDCIVDFTHLEILEHRCSNITAPISEYMRAGGGLQIVGALITEGTRGEVALVREHYDTNKTLQNQVGAPWTTLMLFEGFEASDAFAAYVALVSETLEMHHVPSCYLPCFYEFEQHKLRTLIGQTAHDLRTELRGLRSH